MENTRPSKTQHELLNFIDNFIKTHGYGPSYREVMRALDYKSVSTVAIHINELIKKGHLVKRERSARSLEVVSSEPSSPITAHKAAIKPSQDWLLARIEAKFTAAEAKLTQKLIDDLYVLVGALHVLGLDTEHQVYKKRLLSIKR